MDHMNLIVTVAVRSDEDWEQWARSNGEILPLHELVAERFTSTRQPQLHELVKLLLPSARECHIDEYYSKLSHNNAHK